MQSVHSTTQSYTTQPTVSAKGKLITSLLLVLQKPKREFGTVVRQNLLAAPSVYVIALKSGKLTKEHVETWARDVYFPSTTITSTRLLDSWRGHCLDIINFIPTFSDTIFLTNEDLNFHDRNNIIKMHS